MGFNSAFKGLSKKSRDLFEVFIPTFHSDVILRGGEGDKHGYISADTGVHRVHQLAPPCEQICSVNAFEKNYNIIIRRRLSGLFKSHVWTVF